MLYIDNPVRIFFILGLDVCLSSAVDDVVSDASARLISTHTGRPVKNGRRKVVIVVVVELVIVLFVGVHAKEPLTTSFFQRDGLRWLKRKLADTDVHGTKSQSRPNLMLLTPLLKGPDVPTKVPK